MSTTCFVQSCPLARLLNDTVLPYCTVPGPCAQAVHVVAAIHCDTIVMAAQATYHGYTTASRGISSQKLGWFVGLGVTQGHRKHSHSKANHLHVMLVLLDRDRLTNDEIWGDNLY